MSEVAGREETGVIQRDRMAADALLPLTERVIARLPGPRFLWMVVWAGWLVIVLTIVRYLAPAQLVMFSEREEETTVQFGLLVGYMMLVALWGIGKMGRDVAALATTVERLSEGRVTGGALFHSVGSLWGPLLLMGITTAAYWGPGFVRAPGLAWALVGVAGFVGWLPLLSFAWVAGAVLLGLHRLGGTSLHLTSFEVDRSLGLRPFGSLAFIPLLAYAVAAVPFLLLTGVTDVRDAVITLGMLGTILILLFTSLRRLRGQLMAAKARHLAWARDLYARALHPVRGEEGLPALRAGALELVAAESIERRAAAIQEWPFDEGALRAIVAIVTSVTTAILVRLVLSRLGL